MTEVSKVNMETVEKHANIWRATFLAVFKATAPANLIVITFILGLGNDEILKLESLDQFCVRLGLLLLSISIIGSMIYAFKTVFFTHTHDNMDDYRADRQEIADELNSLMDELEGFDSSEITIAEYKKASKRLRMSMEKFEDTGRIENDFYNKHIKISFAGIVFVSLFSGAGYGLLMAVFVGAPFITSLQSLF